MALVLAEAVRENVVRLTFDQPVYYSRWHDPPDAAFVQRYAIAADPAAIGIDGNPTRPVNVAAVQAVPGDGTQIDVWLDRPMSPTGSSYTITVVDLKSADLSTNLDPTQASFTFTGVQLGTPALSMDMLIGNRDIANPQYGGTATNAGHPYGSGSQSLPQIGHFVVDDTGDYGIDQGLTSYKKRVFRRLTTPKGTFRALPSYGVIIPQSVKRLARANLTDSIAADAEDQIRQEPETVSVSVSLSQSTEDPSLFVYKINAKTTIGVVTDYTVPVPI
jgi:hypothetical protein